MNSKIRKANTFKTMSLCTHVAITFINKNNRNKFRTIPVFKVTKVSAFY